MLIPELDLTLKSWTQTRPRRLLPDYITKSSEQGNLVQESVGKFKIHNNILNFPYLDFLVQKIKEQEIQKSFCRSLPYFSKYPAYFVLYDTR